MSAISGYQIRWRSVTHQYQIRWRSVTHQYQIRWRGVTHHQQRPPNGERGEMGEQATHDASSDAFRTMRRPELCVHS